jgi:2-aminoethylphosphonate-pyruvate transaminase
MTEDGGRIQGWNDKLLFTPGPLATSPTVKQAMLRELGFQEVLRPEDQGYIITSFRYPIHPIFDFDEFYQRLNEKGFVICPGKLSDTDCFCIGRISVSDVRGLLSAIGQTLTEMDIILV